MTPRGDHKCTTTEGPAIPVAEAGAAAEPRLNIQLESVDEVTITTLVDNVTDLLAVDTGPARRPFEPLISRVCAELDQPSPAVIVPAHCTWWAAQRALAERFPAAFIPNTVGTRFQL